MPYAPGVGTGYTSVGDYLDANQGTLSNEASQIAGGVTGDIADARAAAAGVNGLGSTGGDYTTAPGYQDALDKAIAAKDETTALGTTGGMSDYFSGHLGDNQQQADFDAGLLGGSGKLDVSGLQTKANGLTDYLDQQAQRAPAILGGQQRNPMGTQPANPYVNGAPGRGQNAPPVRPIPNPHPR